MPSPATPWPTTRCARRTSHSAPPQAAPPASMPTSTRIHGPIQPLSAAYLKTKPAARISVTAPMRFTQVRPIVDSRSSLCPEACDAAAWEKAGGWGVSFNRNGGGGGAALASGAGGTAMRSAGCSGSAGGGGTGIPGSGAAAADEAAIGGGGAGTGMATTGNSPAVSALASAPRLVRPTKAPPKRTSRRSSARTRASTRASSARSSSTVRCRESLIGVSLPHYLA